MAKIEAKEKTSKLSDKLADWVGKSAATIADAELSAMERACSTMPKFLHPKITEVIEKHKKNKNKFVSDRKAKIESIVSGRSK